jgi:glycosyltransferase involved in cell wall biosynthesis
MSETPPRPGAWTGDGAPVAEATRCRTATLYLCYFGLREPLVQTQVLPYLRQLVVSGVEVYLLTFDPELRARWTRAEIDDRTRSLHAEGIHWSSLAYHKRPSLPATIFDMLVGAWAARRLVRRHGIDVLHARAHVAAVMGGVAKILTNRKLIFDIRGFNPEEYVDAGIWRPGGLKFRLAKAMEHWLFHVADGFVVLTNKARDVLFPGCTDVDLRGRPIEVIPCCVECRRFGSTDGLTKDAAKAELGLSGRRVLTYVGALGGFYLTDEMIEFLATAHRQDPSTFAMILTQSPPELVLKPLARSVIPEESYLVRRVAPTEVPRYLRAADLALSFIKPTYSKQASSPTKVAEYLAGGLPVIANVGIGDLDEVLEAERVGVILRRFDRDAYLTALRVADALRSDPETPARCLASARRCFDLETVGGARYCRLYGRLSAPDGSRGDPSFSRS